MKLLAGLFLLLAGPVAAQEHPCDGAETQIDLNECSYVAWEEADVELNEAYAAAMGVVEPYGEPAQEAFRDAQRAWIAFRDADCAAEAALWEGGSAEPMILYGCLETVTLQRTDDLWANSER